MRLPNQSRPARRANEDAAVVGRFSPSQIRKGWYVPHGSSFPSLGLNFVSNIHALCPWGCGRGYLMVWDWDLGCRCIPHPLGWGLD